MLIALDYDGTYTRDPDLWNLFIHNAKERGHTVVCVTFRNPASCIKDFPGRVYYTDKIAKSAYLSRQGLRPDIWIDDMPFTILNNEFTGA